MTLDILSFRALNQRGFLKPNKYRIMVPIANIMTTIPYYQQLQNQNALLPFRSDSVDLVGVNFQTVPITRYGYGSSIEMPVAAGFDNIMITFYIVSTGKDLNYFQTWMNTIVNFNLSGGILGSDMGGYSLPYELYYKDDYAVEMQITLVNQNDEDVVTYVMKGAYPKLIPPTKLAWNINGDVLRMTVIFAYNNWYIDWNAETTLSNSTGGNGDTMGTLPFNANPSFIGVGGQ